MGKKALLVVDVQNDFCPGGALATKDGADAARVISVIAERFEEAGCPVLYSRDWHPENHSNFKAQGGIWPPHCVAGTEGASFHPDLKVVEGAIILDKATDAAKEAYSAFDGTDADRILKDLGIREIYVCGIATDYCVKETCLDGVKLGYDVSLILDACAAVNVMPRDSDEAVELMRESGVRVVTASEVLEGE